MHELGTIDLFDHAGVDRLLQARRAAEQMGAVSTAAILDLQLAAGFTCRWDLEQCDAHARSAAHLASRCRQLLREWQPNPWAASGCEG